MKQKETQIDDPLWKSVIEDTCGHFLKFFYPDIEKHADFSKAFTFLDKEFESLFPPEPRNKGVRFVDKLVKIHRHGGDQHYILCHIEVQSNKGQGDLAKCMFTYFYRIFDKYKVPITAIAILVDANKNYQPTFFIQEFLGTRVEFKFNNYKVLNQQEDLLRADPNPFAVVVLTVLKALNNKQLNDDKLMDLKLDLYQEMCKREMDSKSRKGIYNFLLYYMNFKEKDNLKVFEEKITQKSGRKSIMGTEEYLLEKAENQGIKKGIVKGIEKGLAQGRKEGKEEGIASTNWRIAKALKDMGTDASTITALTTLTAADIEKL